LFRIDASGRARAIVTDDSAIEHWVVLGVQGRGMVGRREADRGEEAWAES
jgi:hypothetical protein